MIDLSEVKLGDKVRSYTKGWMTVSDVNVTTFGAKTADGRRFFFYYDGRRYSQDENAEIVEWERQVEPWLPKDQEDGYVVLSHGEISSVRFTPPSYRPAYRELGNLFSTREAAEQAARDIRKILLIRQYVLEHASACETTWNREQNNCYIFFQPGSYEYSYGFTLVERIGVENMPEEIARKLVGDLNSGRVSFEGKEA